jgi:hypothetical protein|tara:strand:+ start:7085 stop:13222 length:6138 start_codon:yes stop_codon:yes gene_type:complete
MRTDGGALYTQIEQQLPQFVQHNHGSFSKFIEKYYEFLELNLLTFNDLDLNEYKPIQESNDVTYSISVATGDNSYSNNANKFYISAVASPTLNVSSGTTYIFDQSASTNAGHPLRISQSPNGRHSPGGVEYSEGIDVVTFGTPGQAGAQTSVYISTNLANTALYYYCNTHSGMGGVVSIDNTTPYVSLENGNTELANSSTDYIDFENPNRQGSQFLSGETVEGDESGATGIVKGKYSNTQVYVEENNSGNFRIGERIVGDTSRASANVTLYSRQALNASRNVKSFQDIDKAPSGFVELFRKEFLSGVPKGSLGDKAGLLKNIKDFYRAKGNEASFQFIFRLLFGKEDVQFYYPSTDMLRLSDGRWTKNKTIKIDRIQSNNFSVFEGRVIRGSFSNVTALVERTQTYQVGATTISELYISNVDNTSAIINEDTLEIFTTLQANDTITTTTTDAAGNYGQANVAGILATVEISGGGSNYAVGDELAISGGGGAEAAAKVASVSDATISAVNVIDAGDGYSVGDTVVFSNEGTGGSGGSARVSSITPTANVSVDSLVINTNKDDVISASAFSVPLTEADANTHIFSNSITTFTVGYDGGSGSAPKVGDFIAKFGGTESITKYTSAVSKFGTIITASGTAITYALGSLVFTSTHSAALTLNNFANDDTITIFDTTKDSSGSAKSANGHNAVIRATGATRLINGTPTANVLPEFHGALTGTVTEASIGGIRSVQVLSSGQGYASIPVVTVSNTTIASYGSSFQKVGANSVFITLANNIANQFTSNTIVKNASNSAVGLVLGPITSPTSLVGTGNTVLRVQMSTATTFAADDILTSYQNNAGEQPIGIGDFGQVNISTTGTTATFTHDDHGYVSGQRIVVTGSTSGTDAAVYNNNHTVATVTNTSTYTVTLASDPTDDSESNLTVRRIVTANTAYERLLTEDSDSTQLSFENGVGTSEGTYSTSSSNGFIITEVGIDTSNVVFANTGVAGSSASIAIAAIAIGGIQSVTIYNFGAGYTSAPTIDATVAGDGNASLVSTLGAVADYDGFFDGSQGLLSGQNKMQDNFYYQDFSYVIKTDINTEVYREKITNLVHPSGLKMFGEVVMYANAHVKSFNNGVNTINDTIANTATVANSIGVSSYNHHKISFSNLDTASSNVQIGIQTSLFQASIAPSQTQNLGIKFPSIDFDLVLEQQYSGVGLESSGNFIGFETDTGGTLALEEDGVSNIQFEEFYDSIIQEDGSYLELESDQAASNYLLHEPVNNSFQIISEDKFDVFYIIPEENIDEYYLEQEGTDAEEYFVLEDNSVGGNTYDNGYLYIEEQNPEALRITFEVHGEMSELDTRFIVTDRTSATGFIMPMIQFPETESGAVHIDMGYGSQLKLEDGEYLLLERTEGMFPLYMAMENTMEDEVIRSSEISITPKSYINIAHPLSIGFQSDSNTPYIFEGLLFEDGDRFAIENGTIGNATASVQVEYNLPNGTGRSSSFEVKTEGNVNVTMGELFELLSEAGDRYVEESVITVGNLLTESGDEYIVDQFRGTNNKLSPENSVSSTSTEVRSFISEVYDRRASITGLNTQFSSDFSAPIVLETYSNEHKAAQDGTFITLESHTEDGDLILIEGSDRVFMTIELEAEEGNLALESSEFHVSRRLVYPELLDMIIEEESVSLEEDNKMLIEEGTAGSALTFISEGLDTLVLEHQIGNYGTEQSTASTIQNFTNDDLRIEDLVANISFEDNGSILLEERTPTGIGTLFLFEDGDRILDEDSRVVDGSINELRDAIFILNEKSYMETFSDGQIEVDNTDSDSLCQIELIGDFRFPYGIENNGTFTYISDSEYAGDTAIVSSVVSHSVISVDFGNISLEDGYHVLNEDGDKTKRDVTDLTSRNYKLEYGVYTQSSTIGDDRFMKCELNASDPTFNNIGRGYQFVINGFTSTLSGATSGQINLEELGERLGNDVVYEDGTLILFEDGETTQDPNAIMLEDDSTYLTFEENASMVLEDLDHNYKILNLEAEKYRVDSIANNTFMKLSQDTSLFIDAPFRVNHLESVNARVTS